MLGGDHEEFFFHNVRVLTNAALEDRAVLKHWRLYALVAGLPRAVADGFLDVRHEDVVFREDVVGAFRCSIHRLCHGGYGMDSDWGDPGGVSAERSGDERRGMGVLYCASDMCKCDRRFLAREAHASTLSLNGKGSST